MLAFVAALWPPTTPGPGSAGELQLLRSSPPDDALRAAEPREYRDFDHRLPGRVRCQTQAGFIPRALRGSAVLQEE